MLSHLSRPVNYKWLGGIVKVTRHIDMAVRDMLFPEIAERQDTFRALER